MKPIKLLSVVALAITISQVAATAQEIQTTTLSSKAPKLVVGLKTGIGLTDKSSGLYYKNFNYGLNGSLIPNISNGVFVRYYFGKHLAIETGLNTQLYSRQHLSYYQHTVVEGNGNSTTYYPEASVRYNNFELPVELQYHIGKEDAKLRAYFGVGVGYTKDRFVTNLDYVRSDGSRVHDSFVTSRGYLFFSFTQGLTYQVSDKLQFNQSLRYKFGDMSGIHLNFGLGYTISR